MVVTTARSKKLLAQGSSVSGDGLPRLSAAEQFGYRYPESNRKALYVV